MKPATAHPNRAYHVSLSPSVYSAVEQLARDTRCTLDDVLVEALSALLARCGKGTIEEIDMRCEMIRDAAHISDKVEDHRDKAGELLTKRLMIDLAPELYHRRKVDSARRRLSVPDAIRGLLESAYPEAQRG